jgi:hypothetical protein
VNEELLVARIIAGMLRIKINGKIFTIQQPSRYDKYIAEEIYEEVYDDAINNGIFKEADLVCYMMENDLWGEAQEKQYHTMPGDMDNLKVQIFHAFFNNRAFVEAKALLNNAKKAYAELQMERSSFFFCSAEGLAIFAKNRYLIASGLYIDNKKFSTEYTYPSLPASIIDVVMMEMKDKKLSEAQIRRLCRIEPWYSYWSLRKNEATLFGVPSVDFTDEQKAIAIWSTVYDNIREHPERPHDAVIDDDDTLDGWMLIQKRKREKEAAQSKGNHFINNEKMEGCGEIYVVAPEMAKEYGISRKEAMMEVDSFNDEEAKMTKKRIFTEVSKKGQVSAGDLTVNRRGVKVTYG